MKVHLLMASLSGGGAEHQLTYLANFLYERKCDVSVVTFADMPDHYIVNPNIKRVKIAQGKGKYYKLLALWYYLLTFKTDNLIIFTQRNSCLCLPPLFLRKRINIICGERNLSFGKPSIYEKLLTRLLYNRANHIISNSFSQQTYLASNYSKLASKCDTIINFTDLERYIPIPFKKKAVKKIGVFARIDSQKNCVAFAKAVKRAADSNCAPFVIDWYGSNRTGTFITKEYENLMLLLEQDEMKNIFRVHEPVKDPSAEMANMDIICLPSLFEGFSNSIAEAICAGKPMIVSDVSDNGVMVKEGENGYLFNPTDIDSIAHKIILIVDKTYEELGVMGERSRKLAEQLFDKDKFVNSYLSILNENNESCTD